MILSEHLLQQSQFLDQLEHEIFSKSLSYTINFILNAQNKMKLNQFIEIDQEVGDNITAIFTNIIQYLIQYRVSLNELNKDIQLLRLSKDKKQTLKEKVRKNVDELRKKILYQNEHKKIEFNDLKWRFQIQSNTKTSRGNFKPNIFLNFQFMNNQTQKPINNLVNCDFANLKNLYESLSGALSLHRSNKFKLARNSSI